MVKKYLHDLQLFSSRIGVVGPLRRHHVKVDVLEVVQISEIIKIGEIIQIHRHDKLTIKQSI